MECTNCIQIHKESSQEFSLLSWRCHSCDPNVIDDCRGEGEARAASDIKRGEELTYDYTFLAYSPDPEGCIEQCSCGSVKCRGRMMGFKYLTPEEQEKSLPFVGEAVKAQHLANKGEGLPVKEQQIVFPPRAPVPQDNGVLRLVVPGPSFSLYPVLTKADATTGCYKLYAGKDFEEGEIVYEFWNQVWPEGFGIIDMIFACKLAEGDPEQNTVIRVEALECAKCDSKGVLQFSGFDLLTQHSCDPNMVYNTKDQDEADDWRCVYATRTIQKGEVLTVDFNSLLWDRTAWEGLGDGICKCGSAICRGLVKGFCYLSKQDQLELKSLSWKRSCSPHPLGPPRRGSIMYFLARRCLQTFELAWEVP